jgi:hypothetical protein
MVVSDAQQHLFSKFLVMDDKRGEEKTIKAYLSVCCGGETGQREREIRLALVIWEMWEERNAREAMSGGLLQRLCRIFLIFFYSFCKNIRPFQNLSVLATKRRGARRLDSNRRCPRKAARSGPCSRRGPRRLDFLKNFVNDFKWKNCKHESCVSRKIMKLCSLQLFHLMLFRALKSNLYSTRYNMRRKETKNGHM